MFTKKTVKDVNLKGKTVLVRADYNVPFEHGRISDDYRLEQSVPTLKYLKDQGTRIIICSHLGRPEGSRDERFSLKPVAKRLGELLGETVGFAEDCIGDPAAEALKALKPGGILLLENLRFHAEEEMNDDEFAKKLAGLADIFVQDGFGVVHRAHASTAAITKHIDSVAGLLLEKEVDTITDVVENPKRPLMAVIGGAKIADKIELINRLMDRADFVAVGGAMANTFLLAQGIDIGRSLVDKDDVPLAKDILGRARDISKKRSFTFYLPQDGVVAKEIDSKTHTRIVDWDAHVIADIESYPKPSPRSSSQVADNERILDIGPFSGAFIAGAAQFAETVIWNGTLGVTETDALSGPVGPFAHGTELLIEALLGEHGHKPFSVVGGGDTVSYVEERKMTKHFGHVSTGGGASLELMSGRKLPGVEALPDKDK